MIGVIANVSAAILDDGTAGDPPDGPPTSLAIEFYAGTLVRLLWTNGESDSKVITQIALPLNGNSPTTVVDSVSGAQTSYETGLDITAFTDPGSGVDWYVRHKLNGQFSSWAGPGSEVAT